MIDLKSLKAVVFDYGNTLVEFGRKQIMFCDIALANTLEKHFGKPDLEKLAAVRNRDRLAPYAQGPNQFKENNMVEISTALVRELYSVEPSAEQLADILRARYDIFVRMLAVPEYVPELLKKLSRRYKLGLLSNYPDGNAIRDSLERLGLARYFKAIVVSADLGLVKPHPVPFVTILDQLGVAAGESLLVGDNWLADVQGGRQAGMQVAHMKQWECPEAMPLSDDDLAPTVAIESLSDLEPLLLAD